MSVFFCHICVGCKCCLKESFKGIRATRELRIGYTTGRLLSLRWSMIENPSDFVHISAIRDSKHERNWTSKSQFELYTIRLPYSMQRIFPHTSFNVIWVCLSTNLYILCCDRNFPTKTTEILCGWRKNIYCLPFSRPHTKPQKGTHTHTHKHCTWFNRSARRISSRCSFMKRSYDARYKLLV